MRSKIEDNVIAAALAGTVATVVVATALGALARSRGRSAVQPINATSHWLHGPRAARKRRMDLGHTGTGFLTNHLASMFWAAPLQFLVSPKSPPSEVAAKAAVVSGLAAVVDYGLMPKRLTPGWEHALGKRGVAAGFVALAVGLFAGTLIAQRARAFSDRQSLMTGDTYADEEASPSHMQADDIEDVTDTDDDEFPDLVDIEAYQEESDALDDAAVAAEYDHEQVGPLPKSLVTGRHDEGSDANETPDGLNETDEMTRQNVEDVPSGDGHDAEDIPVFDRGDTLPKV